MKTVRTATECAEMPLSWKTTRRLMTALRRKVAAGLISRVTLAELGGCTLYEISAWLRGRQALRREVALRLVEHFKALLPAEKPRSADRPAQRYPDMSFRECGSDNPPARPLIRFSTGGALCTDDCPDDCRWRIPTHNGDRCPFYVIIPWRRWGCWFYLTVEK